MLKMTQDTINYNYTTKFGCDLELNLPNNYTIKYGTATDIGCCHENQDNSFVWISPNNQTQMFGMLDGHSRQNGKHAAQFAKTFCVKFISTNYKLFIKNAHEFINQIFAGANLAIKDGLKTIYPNFYEVNEELRYSMHGLQIDGGSTFTLLIIHNGKVFVANVGDSSIISCTQSKEARELIAHHSPENIDEFKRIISINPKSQFKYDGKTKRDIFKINSETGEPEITGHVQYYKNIRKEAATLVLRQNEEYMLAMTRSLGDFQLKPEITAEPDINEYSLTDIFGNSLTGAFVLATDGLWDNWTFEDVSKFIMDESCLNSVQIVTDSLMKQNLVYARQNFPKQGDNVTIIVIFVIFAILK